MRMTEIGRGAKPAFAALLTYLPWLGLLGWLAAVSWFLTKEAAVWRGRDSERFTPVSYPMDAVVGKRLQLELFDDELGSWGHIMLDQVMLMQREEAE